LLSISTQIEYTVFHDCGFFIFHCRMLYFSSSDFCVGFELTKAFVTFQCGRRCIEDLFNDFRDGRKLLELLECLTGQKIVCILMLLLYIEDMMLQQLLYIIS